MTSDYDQTIRQTGPAGGPYQLLFRRTKEAYLTDRNDVDTTGAADMGSIVTTYLSEFATAGVRIVYLDRGTVLKATTPIQVPGKLTLTGPDGAHNSFTPNNAQAIIMAGASNSPVIRLTGSAAGLRGVKIDGGKSAGLTGVVALQPESREHLISQVMILNGDAASTAIKGGGLLYTYFDDITIGSGGWDGRGIDLVNSYAVNPPVSYYGINVGWVRRSKFITGKAAIRFEGIFDILDNDFEMGASEPVIMLAAPQYSTTSVITRNYFELSGSVSQAIWAKDNTVSATIEDNRAIGTNPVQAGSYFFKVGGASGNLRIVDNGINRFETGIDHGTGMAVGSMLQTAPNGFGTVTTPYVGGGGGAYTSAPRGFNAVGASYFLGGLAGGMISWTSGTLDLSSGTTFWCEPSGATTLAVSNIRPGQFFWLRFNNANTTLPTATFNLASGADETPPAGTVKQFVTARAVFGGAVKIYEVASKSKTPSVQTATFTASVAADVYPCDATAGAITANLPSATTWTGGPLTIKKTDASANAVTVDPNGTQTVDGATTLALTAQWSAVTVRPSGGNWVVTGKV